MVRFLALILILPACAHQPVSSDDLNRMRRPVFVSRIEENAGPRARVFREDQSYRDRLKRLDPAEADRRLSLKLAAGISRFEVSERIRAGALAVLPKAAPWTNAVPQAQVHTALESFLVEEVPANSPDYELLRPLGADAVVEIVVQDYGLRSELGRSQAFVEGYGRLFFLDGAEVWRWKFRRDNLDAGAPALDPFDVAKDPIRFRETLTQLLDDVALELARQLNPTDRRVGEPLPEGTEELNAPPDSTHRTGRRDEESHPSEGLTPLDPTPPDPVQDKSKP